MNLLLFPNNEKEEEEEEEKVKHFSHVISKAFSKAFIGKKASLYRALNNT